MSPQGHQRQLRDPDFVDHRLPDLRSQAVLVVKTAVIRNTEHPQVEDAGG
jgi:hypothetical protein